MKKGATMLSRRVQQDPRLIDLWPETFGPSHKLPPVAILRYQAKLLGQKTNSHVLADVVSDAPGNQGGTIFHSFFLVAPFLGDFRYKLFYIGHNVNLYPVTLVNAEETSDRRECGDENNFTLHLKEFLGRDRTHEIIRALIEQSES